MRARKVRQLAQVAAEAGLGLGLDAPTGLSAAQPASLYLLIPPHPSGDVPASKRPFLRTHTLPSGLGKMPCLFEQHPFLSVPLMVSCRRTEPVSLVLSVMCWHVIESQILFVVLTFPNFLFIY